MDHPFGVKTTLSKFLTINYMIWITLGLLLLTLVAISLFIPVGKLRGRPLFLRDLANPNTRLLFRLDRGQQAVAECLTLNPLPRLEALLKLEQAYGKLYLIGDQIRSSIVATGLSAAVPFAQRYWENPLGGPATVMQGLRQALKTDAMEPNFRTGMLSLLETGMRSAADDALFSRLEIPHCLLELDPAQGKVRVESSLSPDQMHFKEILAAFNAEAIAVTRSLVEQWLPRYQGVKLGCRDGMEYLECLKALYFHDEAAAQSLLEEVMETQPALELDAAEMLLQIHDLPHPVFMLDDAREKLGIDNLNEAEQTVWLVSQWCYLVSRVQELPEIGCDERGDDLSAMQPALERVGAVKSAAIWQRYLALYGPSGPAPTAAGRIKQMAAHQEAWDPTVAKILQPLQECNESVKLLGFKYELLHGEQIRKRSELSALLRGRQASNPAVANGLLKCPMD
jgi:hypothetical protein